MADPMRVALATFGTEEFAVLHTACVAAGHEPVAYVYCRSMKPKGRVDAYTWAFQDLEDCLSIVDREKCLQAGRISGVYAKMIPYRKALFACMTLPDGLSG